MGLFSAVIGIVSAVVTVGKAIYDFCTSASANKSARNINSANAYSSRNIGQMTAFDRQKATTAELKRINDELGTFKSRASKESETFEVALIDIGRESIKKLTQTLADSGENFAKQCEAEFKKIKGFVLREISNKISLDNAECTDILSKESGEVKEQKMNDFIDKAMKKALRNLGDRFVNSVENNVNAMINTLESKLETRQALANNQVATLEKIKEAKNVEQKQSEQVNLALDLNKKIAILNAIKGV